MITFWSWKAEELKALPDNLEKLKSLTDRRNIMLGIYMHDYGGRKVMSNEDMRYQLYFAREMLEKDEINGIIICSNCIADIGLETVEITKQWLNENKK